MELTGFEDRLGEADLVLTGEGRVDAQTAFGKTALGVAERAREAGVPDHLLRRRRHARRAATFMHERGVVTLAVTERPMSLEDAIAAGTGPISRAAERVARLVDLGRGWADDAARVPRR